MGVERVEMMGGLSDMHGLGGMAGKVEVVMI